MATYDYKCPKCNVTRMVSHSVTSDSTYHCKDCGEEMRKVYSAPGTVFPGTGWGKDAR